MVKAMINILTMTRTPVQEERIKARAVYRIFDASGSLLYVGMSGQPLTRIQAHAKKKWFACADRVEIRWHKTKQSALNAEAVSIIMDKPTFNLASSLIRVRDEYFPIVLVKTSRTGSPKKILSPEAMKGMTMVYTVEELRKLIAQNEIADAAKFCGINYSTMWRIFNGGQEPREGTLKALTKYVEKFNEPL